MCLLSHLKLEIMRAGTYVLCITSPLNAVLNYLLVYTFDFGLLGAPLATGLSYVSRLHIKAFFDCTLI